MITYDDSVTDRPVAQQGAAEQRDRESTYTHILQTLQLCPLGQEDDGRHLTRSVILGEN